jgi:lysophospholipase L1-like esterase
VLFFGDSHVAGLDVASLVPNALNFGIGGDTVRSLAYRLRFYETVKTAKSIAIAVGLNELSTASAERAAGLFADLLNTLDVTRTVVCSVFPVDLSLPSVAAKFGRDMNDRIAEFNERIAALAASKRALFVQSLPPGRFLPAIWHSGDGVHLNPTGYKLWATRLRDCPLLQA